jgi:hypothetical protein
MRKNPMQGIEIDSLKPVSAVVDVLPDRTKDQVVFAVQRMISGLDIELSDLQKGADECLALSIDKLKEIIATSADDDVRIKAINSAISVSNHIIKRRQLQLDEGGSITVNINAEHVPVDMPAKKQLLDNGQ